MTNTNLFSTASETITWLRKIAVPMQNFEGESLPDTGIASVTVPKRVVDILLAGVAGTVERSTSKQSVYNFTFNGSAYTLAVNFGWSDMKRITFTWDHRAEDMSMGYASPYEADPQPAVEAEVEMFKFFYRDLQGNTTLEVHPFEAINNYRMMDGQFLVWREVNGLSKMIAQSKDWTSADVSAVMRQDLERRRPKLSSRLVNGLLVETETGDKTRTRIYFQSTKDNVFSPHIKIYNGTHISLEGNVTIENYGGYLQASEMAVRMLWS